jgi:hypothetical protein
MNIGALLKRELRRIARLEIRPTALQLRGARRTIRKLRQLVREQQRAIAALRRQREGRPRTHDTKRRTLTLSPARRRALKLQGEYMGLVRALAPRQQARVKALRAARGYPPALRLARKLRHG